MNYEDTSIQENQESGQQKPAARRDKVVVTKVTEKELSLIKSTAEQCGMTRSDFIRARAIGSNQGGDFRARNWTVSSGSLPAARTW